MIKKSSIIIRQCFAFKFWTIHEQCRPIFTIYQATIHGLQACLRHQTMVRNAKTKIILTNLRGVLAPKNTKSLFIDKFGIFYGQANPANWSG